MPPTAPPRHILAATALVTNARNHILMILSPRRGWEIPGGQIEEGEDVITGLKREVMEETGIRIEVQELKGVYTNISSPILILAFTAGYVSGKPRPSPESEEVAWVSRDECLKKIEHAAIHQRTRDLMESREGIVYRAYSNPPFRPILDLPV